MLKHFRYLLILIFTTILFLHSFLSASFAETENVQENTITKNTELGFELYSPHILLMDLKSGQVLYEYNAREIIYPASTTKIMTAILALEKCNLTDIATVSHNAIFSIPPTYQMSNIQEGEELTIEQLLHVLLIPSANDAAVVLAEHIGGSVENFATMMNEKAKEIGCENTNFVNPNGVHDDNHYTTTYDMALIGKYAMQFQAFRSIVQKTKYTLPTTNKYDKEDRIFRTTNELIRENHSSSPSNYYYEYCTGIKTGFTNPAQNCIVASAKKDDREFLVSIMGGTRTENFLKGRELDCKSLFEYAFQTYQTKTLVEANQVVTNISVPEATSETKYLDLYASNSLSVVTRQDAEEIEVPANIELREDLKAPFSEGEVVGKVSYAIEGTVYETELIASHTVYRVDYIRILLYALLVIFLLMILTVLKENHRKKKKKSSSKHSSGKRKKSNTRKTGGHYRYMQLHSYED